MQLTGRTLLYLTTFFAVLVIPRALQRFRLPAPLTSFAMGILAAIFVKRLVEDEVLPVIATLGIASLFLFAGLEVDLDEIRHRLLRLITNFLIRGLFLAGMAWLAIRYLQLSWQAAMLLALAVFTPSTGFILDTLPRSGLDPDEQTEVAINAIAGEIAALLALFFVSQAGSAQTLLVSGGGLVLLIVLTPFVYLALGRYVVSHAPESQFSLLLMVGIICAVITKALGVYYLVGAFVAGIVAGLLKKRMPDLASPTNLHAIRLFASFFVPFYFFHGGLEVPPGALVFQSLLYGAGFALLVLPVRISKNWAQARYLSRRTAGSGLRIAIALTPTLIFTLVIANILREKFHVDDALFGGLLVYAAVSTTLPSLVLPRLAQPTLSLTDVGATSEPLRAAEAAN
jgi:Kef-type K+ transport system membrane component KefB